MKLKNKIRIISLLLVGLFIIQSSPVYAVNASSSSNVSDGILSVFPFSTIDMGRAGELNVNQQNQEAVIERTDISLPGCSFPVDITFYYSSFLSNKWHFNYCIELEKTDNEIVMTKNDGSQAIYEPTGELINGKEKWIIPEEFGVIDYLLVPTGEYRLSDVVLVSKLDGELYFSDIGKLSSIIHKDGTNTGLYYDDIGRISKIVDSNGNQYYISYNEDDNIEEISVFDSEDKIITFESGNNASQPCTIRYIYDNDYLINIIYPDGCKVEYAYKKGNPVFIKNVDGKCYQIDYNGARTKSVKQLSDNSQKILFGIKTTKDGVLLTDEYSTNVKKTFNGITPETMKKVGSEYIAKIRKINSSKNNVSKKLKLLDNTEASSGIMLQSSTGKREKNIKSSMDLYDFSSDESNVVLDFANNVIEMSTSVSHIVSELKIEYIYEADVLKSITRDTQKYDFLYDEWGNNTGVEIQGHPYIKYSYKDGKYELCEQIIYGNGQTVNYYYNDDNKLTGVSLDDGNSMIYEYLYSGADIKVVDNQAGVIQNYTSDSLKVTDINTNEVLVAFSLKDEDTLVMNIGNDEVLLSVDFYTNNEDSGYKTILNFVFENLYSEISVVKDCFDRINNYRIEYSTGDVLNTNINYLQYKTNETALPCEFISEYSRDNVTYSNKWSYDYYDNGKIKNVYLNDEIYTHYEYDNIGQLIRADDYILSASTLYEYDNGGNLILKKKNKLKEDTCEKNIVSLYNNAWKDQLTFFDGNCIIYDGVGNPLSYKNNTYKWNSGRQLEKIVNNVQKIEYTYNDMGYRQTKTVYDKKTDSLMYQYNYYWGDGFIIAYTLTDYTKLTPATDTVVYQYDDNMNIYSYIVNGEDVYIYDKNASGDIVGIYNEGKCVEKYHYDEYGKVYTLLSNEATSKYNQLYYRGYLYDVETELYYLQSRYYSPEWGRFINADVYVDTGSGLLGTNMYIYCDNDPINKIDPTGYWGVSLHQQLTLEVLDGIDLGYNLDVDKIADGNAYTDTKYSAVIFFGMPTRQGRHFDRHIRVEEAEGKDTRGYYAAEHMDTAIEAYFDKDYDKLNEELGFALHCLQDVSAHGNIDVNRWALADHATITGVDNADYEWSDDTDRGATNKNNCVYKGNKTYGSRYDEALEITTVGFVLFILLLEQEIKA